MKQAIVIGQRNKANYIAYQEQKEDYQTRAKILIPIKKETRDNDI
jgi:hypothetical protein